MPTLTGNMCEEIKESDSLMYQRDKKYECPYYSFKPIVKSPHPSKTLWQLGWQHLKAQIIYKIKITSNNNGNAKNLSGQNILIKNNKR